MLRVCICALREGEGGGGGDHHAEGLHQRPAGREKGGGGITTLRFY